jgi:hypothetical protein
MLQSKFVAGAADDPRSRAILADMERDSDLVLGAFPHVHDEGLGAENRVGGHAFSDGAHEGLSA